MLNRRIFAAIAFLAGIVAAQTPVAPMVVTTTDGSMGLRVTNGSSLTTNVLSGGVNVSYTGSTAGTGGLVPTSSGIRLYTGGDRMDIRIGAAFPTGGTYTTLDWLTLNNTSATFANDVHVNGGLYIGTTGWSIKAPDFVFGKDYHLAPLGEVESFVKKNRHLPGISSASDMENAKSVDLVQMNLDLLKKVEEITLYMIDQNKKIEALQNQLGEKN